ncbi:hypothetical protein WJX73_004348 [Symbiochloris irregularis]|uniref:Uncharacterized protein n=1 Tax=Symbiochloris irregularis TaxID=706552 RepID=A0AAW1PBZ7_9CHLO
MRLARPMAADAKSFGISLGLNAAVCFFCLVFFGFFRATKITQKFYAPKRYLPEQTYRPRKLSRNFWGWIMPTLSASEEEVILVAGVDAAMYLRIMKFGLELFIFTTILTLIMVLPVNLSGGNVDRLTSPGEAQSSQFTYWVSPPPPSGPDYPPTPDNQAIKAPDFYEETPPAPPGIVWWRYNPDVPPAVYQETSRQTLGAQFAEYGWRYDSSFQTQSYTFSVLDHATMSNVAQRSHLLWVHMVAVWIISLWAFRMLRRYSQHAVALRLRYYATTNKGAESHSVLVLDVPGVLAGSFVDRMDALFPFLPKSMQRVLRKRALAAQRGAMRRASSLQTKVTQTAVGAGRKVAAMGRTPRRSAEPGLDDTHRDSPRELIADGTERSTDPDQAQAKPGATAQLNSAFQQDAEKARSVRHPERVTETDAHAKCRGLLDSGLAATEVVEREFNELYVGDVAAVHMVYLCPDLDQLVAEYGKLREKLLDLLDGYISTKRRGKPMTRQTTRVLGIKYGEWGKTNYPGKKPVKTDALDWYIKRITEVRRLIHESEPAAKEESTATAFVTFRTRRAQMVASNCMSHHDQRAWTVIQAPGPKELIWKNLRWRTWEHQTRTAVIWAAFIALTLFYLIPIGAIQALIEVDRLNHIGFFRALIRIKVINAILQSILPSLVLKIFLAILPMLLAFMNRKQGMVSESAVDFGVTMKFFIFQVVSVFLGSFIAGSLFNQFEQWIKDPTSAVTILGTAAPLTSIFFLNYVELNALTSIPVQFLRPFGIFLYWVLTLLSGTERAKARKWSDQWIKFGPDVPDHTMTILFGLTFSCINPLLPPMCIIYFFIALLTEKYNMLYIERPRYQSGGQMWRQIFEQIIVGLLCFQVVMAALLGIKKSFSAILLIPLIALTLVFRSACLNLFRRPLEVQSVRAAVDLDSYDRVVELNGEAEGDNIDKNAYLQPALSFNDAECDAVLDEARHMEEVLAGNKDVPEDVEVGVEDRTVSGIPEGNEYEGGTASGEADVAEAKRATSLRDHLVELNPRRQSRGDADIV